MTRRRSGPESYGAAARRDGPATRWAALSVVAGLLASGAAASGWREAAAAALGTTLVALFAPVAYTVLVQRMRPFAYFAAVTLVLGGIGPGRTILELGPLHWGAESVQAAGIAALRLLTFGAVFGWIGLRLGTARIAAGLWRFGRSLARYGVKLDALFLAFAVAVRFLPLLQDEAARLRLAWEARGGSLAGPGVLRRVRSLAGIAVPLLASALRRADDFASAVHVRSRGGLVPPDAPPGGVLGAAGGALAAGRSDGASGGLVPQVTWRALACVAAAWLGVVARVWS